MSGTAADLLIIYEAEAEQWASYMRSVFSGPVAPDDGICCYDIATVTGRKSQEDFLCLVQYRCKLLILSRGLLEALCPLTRFFLARVLTPPGQVVVLLCGVPSLAPLLEQVPLQGDDYLQISSEQEAHEYTATMADIVRRGAQTTSMEPVSRRASGPEVRLEKKLSTGAAAAKASLLVVPSRVSCEAPGEVYLLLQECVGREAEVEFTAGKHKVRVKTTSWSDNTLSVNAPKLPAGSVGVTLYCGGVAKSKSNLQYYSALGEVAHLLSKVADPVDFMCQAFQVCSVEELDETLAGCLMHKLPTGGLRELQLDQGLEAGASGASREDIPTLLHFVAQHGLRDLGGVLLQCPGAQNALCSANRYGQTPLDLAQAHGHTQLHILLKGALNAQSGEEGEDSSVYEMMSTAGNPKARPPEDPPQASGEEEEDQEEEEEEDPYAPLGVNDEEYDTILSPSNSLVIANRPPAPTPRPENMPIKEDRTPFIAQVFQKKMPQPDSGTLYSVPLKQVRERESISSTYDTFVASQSPPGLDELISLQQQVKLGTLSVDDALNRFSQWQRLQKGVDSSQQEKLRQMRASLVNYRDDDDSVYDKINIIHHTPNVAVKDCRRGSQPAESDFYSKPLKGQQSNLFWKADKR